MSEPILDLNDEEKVFFVKLFTALAAAETTFSRVMGADVDERTVEALGAACAAYDTALYDGDDNKTRTIINGIRGKLVNLANVNKLVEQLGL